MIIRQCSSTNSPPVMNQRSTVKLMLATCISTLCAGCAGVGDSLKLQNTVLVKVPLKEPIAKGSGHGWEFRHVLQAPNGFWRDGQWYVAWNSKDPLSSNALTPYWRSVFRRAPEISDATFIAFKQYPILIEPNRTFTKAVSKQGADAGGKPVTTVPSGSQTLQVGKSPSPAWPQVRTADGKIDPLWYLGDNYTELASARREVGAPRNGKRIRIGHLDNGYDERQAGLPRHLVKTDYHANAVGLLKLAQGLTNERVAPGETAASHGTGTLGILAGGRVSIHDPKGKVADPGAATGGIDLGGAPEAEVIPVRVAPWVASFNTAEMAYSIDYASRVQKCDVISMSHGGAPTQAWVDAVNAAYERGTAMFAAESDFFSLMGNPFKPNGILLPASPVYPAAFRRVIGVTGVTAEGSSYGRNSYWRLLLAPWKIASWAARGSYGADGTSSVSYRPDRKPDPSQSFRQGTRRPHPIAAYSPNIAWLAARQEGKQRLADGVDLDGGGTSASTPQVAAAAALWLQKHRGEFKSEEEWRSWKKAEAVYYALLKTADPQGRSDADPYLGAGVLKAHRALAISYADAQRARKPDPEAVPPPGSLYFDITRDDYFDGARSALSFFGLQTLKHVRLRDRAELWQQPLPKETREDALTRLYYNLGLLREWHGGDLPEKRDQARYWERAKRLAARGTRTAN